MDDLRNDIERYEKGELSPAEMHELERKALSDPFLADALEGSGSIDAKEFSEDIESLRERLDRRRKPIVPLWVWASRIAAGLAVVALITFTWLNYPSDKESLAEGGTEKPAAKAETSADSLAASDHIASADESVPPVRPRRPSPMSAPAVEETVEEDVAVPENLLDDNDFLLPEREKIASRPAKTISGFVVDAEDGRALPGVNVTIKGSNVGTITDEEGNYQIALDSLNEGLVFSYIGFETREVVPGSTNDVDVALEPDLSELSEVVVVGYGTREPAGVDAAMVEMAEPSGGRKAYKQYLEKNLRYPEQALNNKVEGKVTVQFTILSSGAVSDFRVVKGLGYGCEEEVIRLIEEGPKWQPTKRNHQPVTDKVKVRLKFSLPKKK